MRYLSSTKVKQDFSPEWRGIPSTSSHSIWQNVTTPNKVAGFPEASRYTSKAPKARITLALSTTDPQIKDKGSDESVKQEADGWVNE